MQQGVFAGEQLAVCLSQGCLTCPRSSALSGDHITGHQAQHGDAQESPEHRGLPHAEQLYWSPLKGTAKLSCPHRHTQCPPASLGTGVLNLFKGGT